MTYTEYWTWITGCVLVLLGTVFYGGYEMGYGEARVEYSKLVKYRCYEGIVYRNASGYWEDTKQACKTLEQIK